MRRGFLDDVVGLQGPRSGGVVEKRSSDPHPGALERPRQRREQSRAERIVASREEIVFPAPISSLIRRARMGACKVSDGIVRK